MENEIKMKRKKIQNHNQSLFSSTMPVPSFLQCFILDGNQCNWSVRSCSNSSRNEEKHLIYRLSCQVARSSLPTPTLDLSTMRTLYFSYTLARFSAHQFSACFSLNRFRLHSTKLKTQITNYKIANHETLYNYLICPARLQNKTLPFSRYVEYGNDQDMKQQKTIL